MSKLIRYTNFEALKSSEKSSNVAPIKDNNFLSEFEAFLKRLQREYSNKKKTKADNGKQPN